MRTEQRKTSLDSVSQNYQEQLVEKNKQHENKNNSSVSASPTIGIIVGACGSLGSLIAWVSGVHELLAALLAVLGCVGAVCCKGNNNDSYDGLGIKICITAALISMAAGIIILSFYFKGLGIWEFAFQ